jgi:hypothetical protein
MFLKENNGKPLPLLMQCCFQVIRKSSTVWKQFHCFSHCWRHVIQSPKWFKVKFVHTLFLHLYLVVITSGCSGWYKTQKSLCQPASRSSVWSFKVESTVEDQTDGKHFIQLVVGMVMKTRRSWKLSGSAVHMHTQSRI